MTIKKLEWESDDNCSYFEPTHSASTPIGEYSIKETEGFGVDLRFCNDPIGSFPDTARAKTAAQTHFTGIIASCFDVF